MVSPPPLPHCPGAALQAEGGVLQEEQEHASQISGEGSVQGTVGPVGTECSCWGGALSQSVMLLGLGCREVLILCVPATED